MSREPDVRSTTCHAHSAVLDAPSTAVRAFSSPVRAHDCCQGLQPLVSPAHISSSCPSSSARRADETCPGSGHTRICNGSTRSISRRALTLVEVICAITVIGVIAAVILPVLSGATDAYANASNTRQAVDAAAYAMERSVRLLRDAPPGSIQGTVGIASATPQSITFTDGRGLELSGSTLLLRENATTTAPLCRNVTTFSLAYLATDGVTSVIATPTATHRFNITIAAAGMELRTSAFPRVELIP